MPSPAPATSLLHPKPADAQPKPRQKQTRFPSPGHQTLFLTFFHEGKLCFILLARTATVSFSPFTTAASVAPTSPALDFTHGHLHAPLPDRAHHQQPGRRPSLGSPAPTKAAPFRVPRSGECARARLPRKQICYVRVGSFFFFFFFALASLTHDDLHELRPPAPCACGEAVGVGPRPRRGPAVRFCRRGQRLLRAPSAPGALRRVVHFIS